MEQTYPCKCHRYTIFITSIDHMIVTNGTACLYDIFDTAFMSTFDVVTEGEESI